MTDNTEAKGSVEEHRQESGRTEEQQGVPPQRKLSREEQLSRWTKKVPLKGPIIILNPHPNLIAKLKEISQGKVEVEEQS